MGGGRSYCRVVAALDPVVRDLRGLHRLPAGAGASRARGSGAVYRGGSGELHVLLRRTCVTDGWRIRMDRGRTPGCARRGDGASAAAVAANGAAGQPRYGTSGPGCGDGAGVRDCGDSDATPSTVDHDWVGARRSGAGVVVHEDSAPRPALLDTRPVGRRVRSPRDEPRDSAVRTQGPDAYPELVSLYVSCLRGGVPARRVVALSIGRPRLIDRAHVIVDPLGSGCHPAVSLAEY